jgi:hypothetical protein
MLSTMMGPPLARVTNHDAERAHADAIVAAASHRALCENPDLVPPVPSLAPSPAPTRPLFRRHPCPFGALKLCRSPPPQLWRGGGVHDGTRCLSVRWKEPHPDTSSPSPWATVARSRSGKRCPTTAGGTGATGASCCGPPHQLSYASQPIVGPLAPPKHFFFGHARVVVAASAALLSSPDRACLSSGATAMSCATMLRR